MRICGVGGALRVGHQVAARLGAWTLTRTRVGGEPEYEAEAQILSSDTYWIQQAPMDVEFIMGNRRWTWTGIQPSIRHQSLVAVLVGGPTIH